MRQYFEQPIIATLIILCGFGIHLTNGGSARASATPQTAISITSPTRLDSLRRESARLENTIAQLTRLDTDLRASIPPSGESREALALTARIDAIEQLFRSIPDGASATQSLLPSAVDKQRQAVSALTLLVDEQREILSSIPLLTPAVGTLSSEFGERVHPITGVRQMHTGIDLAAPKGTSITAANTGTVLFAGVKGGYGNAVMIDHGHGYWTLYGHASKLLVKEGDHVEKGAEIALVGSTGVSTGPHLHYEVIVDSTKIDPLAFLQQPAQPPLPRATATRRTMAKATRGASALAATVARLPGARNQPL